MGLLSPYPHFIRLLLLSFIFITVQSTKGESISLIYSLISLLLSHVFIRLFLLFPYISYRNPIISLLSLLHCHRVQRRYWFISSIVGAKRASSLESLSLYGWWPPWSVFSSPHLLFPPSSASSCLFTTPSSSSFFILFFSFSLLSLAYLRSSHWLDIIYLSWVLTIPSLNQIDGFFL